MSNLSNKKPSPTEVLNLAVTLLAIIGGLATVFSCVLAFLTFINPSGIQRVLVELYPAPTPPPLIITSIAPTQMPLLTYTPLPTYTPYSTQTPIPRPTATITAIPTFASGQLLFSDNFDMGPSSQWKFITGNWITANGRLTTLYNGDNYIWLWAQLDQPNWTNYRISFDLEHATNMGTFATQQMAVAVRVTNRQSKFLAFTCGNGCRWAFIGTGTSNVQEIAGWGTEALQKATYEIEVVGNQFVAKINGREVQRIVLTGYDSGGIALGLTCNYSLGCPSFDNFKVVAP